MKVNDGPTAEELAEDQAEDDREITAQEWADWNGRRMAEALGDSDEPTSPDSVALAEIARLEEECEHWEANWLAKKESAKDAKETLDAAIGRLRAACRRRQPTEADRAVDAILAAGRATLANPPIIDPALDESWREIPILKLREHGVTTAMEDRLRYAGIHTIGDLVERMNQGTVATEVPGIGAAKTEKIEVALERFWAANPQYCKPVSRRDAEAAEKDKAVCAQPELKIQNHDPLPGQGSFLEKKPKPRRIKGGGDFGGGPHISEGIAKL